MTSEHPILPRGVTPTASGRYLVRIRRKGVVRRDYADTMDAALALWRQWDAEMGPPQPSRVPNHADWDAEYARQLAALPPGTSLRNITRIRNGVMLQMTRNRQHHYGGFYQDLAAAVAARDEMEANHPTTR